MMMIETVLLNISIISSLCCYCMPLRFRCYTACLPCRPQIPQDQQEKLSGGGGGEKDASSPENDASSSSCPISSAVAGGGGREAGNSNAQIPLMDIVVERLQPAAMAEKYYQAFVEIHDKGLVHRGKVLRGL